MVRMAADRFDRIEGGRKTAAAGPGIGVGTRRDGMEAPRPC
jgi:hypothetical protein